MSGCDSNGSNGNFHYRECTIELRDIKVGDMVIGTDGKWHEVKKIYPRFIPKTMFRLTFEGGHVDCSGDHQWTVFLGESEYQEGGDHVFAIVNGVDVASNNQEIGGSASEDVVSLGAVETRMLPAYMEQFGSFLHVGTWDGPVLLSCEPITPVESMCVLVDNDDHQFQILLTPPEAENGTL